jgi:hypothetical protein
MFLVSIGIKSSESCRCGTFPVNGGERLSDTIGRFS